MSDPITLARQATGRYQNGIDAWDREHKSLERCRANHAKVHIVSIALSAVTLAFCYFSHPCEGKQRFIYPLNLATAVGAELGCQWHRLSKAELVPEEENFYRSVARINELPKTEFDFPFKGEQRAKIAHICHLLVRTLVVASGGIALFRGGRWAIASAHAVALCQLTTQWCGCERYKRANQRYSRYKLTLVQRICAKNNLQFDLASVSQDVWAGTKVFSLR